MIFDENGLIENFQIAICAVAAILFFTTANRQFMKSRLDQSAVSFFLVIFDALTMVELPLHHPLRKRVKDYQKKRIKYLRKRPPLE